MENKLAISEGKTTAIISYLTWIGTVVAYIMNSSKKNHFASFHIRQMVGLGVCQLINWWIIYKFVGKMAGGIIAFVLFVLWVIGFIGALKGEYKKVPLLGDQFQEWFKGI